jgi:hypothetical protein
MRKRSASFFGSCLLCVALSACGSAPTPKAAPPTGPSATPPAPPPPPPEPSPSAEAPPAQVKESPGFHEAIALLRPAGTEEIVAALVAAPSSAEAYAQAAIAFSATEVPVMTLIWGMTYQAMGGGKSDAAVAKAFAKVLTERIVATPSDNGKDVNFSLRLAPGAMPVRQGPDGAVQGPFAHVFEGLFGPAVVGFRPPWTIEQYYDAISTWIGVVSTRGTPLDEKLELDKWLTAAARAEHLEAFCHQLLGPAFPAEYRAYKHGSARDLKLYAAFVKAAPFRTDHALLPDDLVRME